jgi:asparagine synthetase B (glutamine-hydrolysing)
MADFLIRFGSDRHLLELLRQPYGARAPRGREFTFPWGRVAVLADPVANGRNIVTVGTSVLAWVGELVAPSELSVLETALGSLEAASMSSDGGGFLQALQATGLLGQLNGAFALLVATNRHVAVVTDPMGSVQVYEGRGGGTVTALGTHPDLTARCAGDEYEIDPVSVGEFINTGIACFPATMFRNVREVMPGTVWCWSAGTDGQAGSSDPREFRYWTPPNEESAGKAREFEDEFVRRWQKAVEVRCRGEKLGVQLSGGLDSRIVMAAIPKDRECVGVTLCDTINREAEIARRVAAVYGRPWEPLYRDPEYLGQTLMPATRFVGCEGEWHHGHTLGFADSLADMGVDAVFTGLLMDNNFKGYYALDVKREARAGGLLGARYRVEPVDYASQISAHCRQHVRSATVEAIQERRRAFAANHFARNRWSAAEWLDGFPYSQACDNTGWVIERRVLPMRLPVMDRTLVDLAFRIPMQLKAGGRFFEKAAVRILGPGREVPNANNGVKPGSGHWTMILQRALRKTKNTQRRMLSRLGVKQPVPHSWHDFQGYWRDSQVFAALRDEHADQLRALDVFSSDPVELVRSRTTSWQLGCRLLQLAAWKSLLKEYRATPC